MKKPMLLALGVMVAGCTSVNVRPVDPSLTMNLVCIQENSKVLVSDFVPVVRDGFERHGIPTLVFSDKKPDQCEYVLSYTALRSWDLAPYLSHAEIRIDNNGKQIAFAEYHLAGGGGFSLAKWGDTKSKIDPVIDELLKRNL